MGGLWHCSLRRPSGQWGRPMEKLQVRWELLLMEKSWRGPPSPRIPGSMVPPHPRPASSPLVQDSPRPTFSSSAFCQRRKMRRKQRSRAPKEVKKCCRRERGVSSWEDTRSGRRKLHLCTRCVPDVSTAIPSLTLQDVSSVPSPSVDNSGVPLMKRWPLALPRDSRSRAGDRVSPEWLGC